MTNKQKVATLLLYTLQAIFVLGILFVPLRLYDYDLRVPFSYSGDSLVQLMFIKGLLLNGWTFDIPQLSAPYGMSAAAFPLMTNFDWLIMKVFSVVTSEPGLILNLFWVLTLVFSASSATFCMQLLGLGRLYSFATGILYAFLPFALLRNVGHLNLVYYLVPFLALLSINLACGLKLNNDQLIRRITYVVCIAQGFNYIYYGFYAVVLLIFATFLGYFKHRSRIIVHVGAIAVGLIIGATLINLSPSFYSWYKHGKPPEMEYKYSAEAEIFGAKIRKMIAPHKDNTLPLFPIWGKKDIAANYPNENENVTARLGLASTVGFILLLLISLRIVRPIEEVEIPLTALAALSLFTLLVITVGGFGAVFNLLIAPDIRCYNRFSVFIAFFALAGLGLCLKTWIPAIHSPQIRSVAIMGVAFLICMSLYDQLLDRSHLVAGQKSYIRQQREDKNMFNKLKALYPNGIAVLQLPMTGFPPLSKHEKMSSYDHLRPFLWADGSFRWSWPSFSQRHRAWQDEISALQGSDLLKATVYSGFGAIWIDRYGYADNGKQIISTLLAAGAKNLLPDMSSRHVVLDLQEVTEGIKLKLGAELFELQQQASLCPPILTWRKGVYALEYSGANGRKFRWSQAKSSANIRYSGKSPWHGTLSFIVAAGNRGNFKVSCGEKSISGIVSSVPAQVQFPLTIEPESNLIVEFIGDMEKYLVPGEKRELYFYLMDMRLLPAKK